MCCGDCGECWYVGNPRTCKCLNETPKREWIGMTDEEREELTPHKGSSLYEYTYDDVLNILLLADAKLRSKNQ
jgi:hypothetical protein